MKKVVVDEEGDVRCPKCGAKNFVGKRTIKGAIVGGFVFAPKRAKCLGCGKTLKSA